VCIVYVVLCVVDDAKLAKRPPVYIMSKTVCRSVRTRVHNHLCAQPQ